MHGAGGGGEGGVDGGGGEGGGGGGDGGGGGGGEGELVPSVCPPPQAQQRLFAVKSPSSLELSQPAGAWLLS